MRGEQGLDRAQDREVATGVVVVAEQQLSAAKDGVRALDSSRI